MNRTTPPHGTLSRYQWRTKPCRCQACRAANARKVWEWRHRPRQLRLPDEFLPREKVAS